MSHTAQIAADYADKTALAAAVERIGGLLLGEGFHCLYSSTEIGVGIQLRGWNYPIVVRPDNTLAYDNYKGRWGNPGDLDRLHEEYSWAITEMAAQRVGWQTERTADGVRVYHPSGATIVVTGAAVELSGFTGGACVEAMRQLALPVENSQAKASMGECAAVCQEAV